VTQGGLGGVRAIHEERGTILVTSGAGIFRWNGTGYTVVPGAPISRTDRTLWIEPGIAPDGQFYGANRDGLYEQVATGTWPRYFVPQPPGNNITNVMMFSSRIYVNTFSEGVGRFDGTSWKYWLTALGGGSGPCRLPACDPDTSFLNPAFAFALVDDDSGRVWVSTWGVTDDQVRNPGALERIDDSIDPPSFDRISHWPDADRSQRAPPPSASARPATRRDDLDRPGWRGRASYPIGIDGTISTGTGSGPTVRRTADSRPAASCPDHRPYRTGVDRGSRAAVYSSSTTPDTIEYVLPNESRDVRHRGCRDSVWRTTSDVRIYSQDRRHRAQRAVGAGRPRKMPATSWTSRSTARSGGHSERHRVYNRDSSTRNDRGGQLAAGQRRHQTIGSIGRPGRSGSASADSIASTRFHAATTDVHRSACVCDRASSMGAGLRRAATSRLLWRGLRSGWPTRELVPRRARGAWCGTASIRTGAWFDRNLFRAGALGSALDAGARGHAPLLPRMRRPHAAPLVTANGRVISARILDGPPPAWDRLLREIPAPRRRDRSLGGSPMPAAAYALIAVGDDGDLAGVGVVIERRQDTTGSTPYLAGAPLARAGAARVDSACAGALDELALGCAWSAARGSAIGRGPPIAADVLVRLPGAHPGRNGGGRSASRARRGQEAAADLGQHLNASAARSVHRRRRLWSRLRVHQRQSRMVGTRDPADRAVEKTRWRSALRRTRAPVRVARGQWLLAERCSWIIATRGVVEWHSSGAAPAFVQLLLWRDQWAAAGSERLNLGGARSRHPGVVQAGARLGNRRCRCAGSAPATLRGPGSGLAAGRLRAGRAWGTA
jgi:hypothetical protein